MEYIKHASLKQIFEIDKKLYSKNPHFGMNIFADNFNPSGCVILENNAIACRAISVRCDYYRLSLSIKGEYSRHINQYDYNISGHTLQLVHPGDIHSFEYTSSSLEYILLFEKDFFEDNIKELIEFHKKDYQYIKLDGSKYKKILKLFELINLEYKTREVNYIEISKNILSQILYFLKREKLSIPKEIIINRAQQIKNDFLSLVEEYFQEKKSVQEYADLLEITPKYLSEIIKNIMGKSALYFIHKRILKEIQYLLWYSNKSIKQIASLLNFQNSSELGRFFKRYEKISPKNYRLNR
jgi:AraC family transcriptional activator of pobA